MKSVSIDKVNYALDALAALDRSALAKQWEDEFGC